MEISSDGRVWETLCMACQTIPLESKIRACLLVQIKDLFSQTEASSALSWLFWCQLSMDLGYKCCKGSDSLNATCNFPDDRFLRTLTTCPLHFTVNL